MRRARRGMRGAGFAVWLLAVGCFAPQVDVRGKLCDASCPSPFVCGLGTGGGPPVCQDAFAQANRCAQSPHACGFPDETNVGVPAGSALRKVPSELTQGTGWHWDAATGTVVVDGPGATVSLLDVTGAVRVGVPGVSLERVRVTAAGADQGIHFDAAAEGGKIVDAEVRGVDAQGGRVGAAVFSQAAQVTVLRVLISRAAQGVSAPGGLVQDSYMHEMGTNGSDSPAGVVSGGGGGLTVRHSTVLLDLPGNCAVCLFQDYGAQANDTFDGNLLAGGNYTVYGGDGSSPTHDIRITHNRFSRLLQPKGGVYGTLAHFASQDPGNLLQGNVWDEDGSPVAP